MDIQQYFIYFIIITAFGVFYSRWEKKYIDEDKDETTEHIRQFLLNRELTQNIDIFAKPFLWIHVDSELNSRTWSSFNSRSSREINKPYMFYTIKSIIKKCDKTFNVCLIDDTSFSKLINNWTIDLQRVDKTLRDKIRAMAIGKLLYIYGGINVPASFLCMKNLKDVYYKNINNTGMFSCEKLDKTSYVTQTRFLPNHNFIGCKRKNPNMKEYYKYIETLISADYTSCSDFNDTISKYLSDMVNDKRIGLVNGKLIGVKDNNDKIIKLEDLFNTGYIDIPDESFGIYIPDREISIRTHYNWFLTVSLEDLLKSDMIICKYLLIANE
jgi:hypothetical protein